MRPSYDVGGAQNTAKKDYDIASSTVIYEGQVVALSAGKVVLAAVGQTSAILGVAAENHTGVADPFFASNGHASNGTRISVYDGPTQIFEAVAPQVTATSGTTATLVATGIATFADSDFVGGYMKLISKAVASTNTDSLGTVYPITGFTATSKTFTTTQTAGGAITSGDVFAIFPPIGFQKGNLDSNISKYDLTATAALALKTADFDVNRNVVYMQAALHQNSNKQA